MFKRLQLRAADDRGSSPIQMAIIFPIVLLLFVAIVQSILWAYSRNVAYTAAREGLAAGRAYQASPADGADRTSETLTRLGGNLVTSSSVSTAGSTGERIVIRVEGSAMSLVPGVANWQLSATVSGPRERWTTAGGE
ncbi:TadE family protein [Streptomyces monticola]|uniref:TadE family protein n=1 Tax=Streptomyces monticola TaxID=2666263 RepID=A0ABW2JUR3_9ACTN